MLILFYASTVRSLLSYAAPAWYSYTTKHAREQLEVHQSRCLRNIFSHIDSYTPGLSLESAELPRINTYLDNICTKYVNNIYQNPSHCLRPHLPPRQSSHRHSSRRKNVIVKWHKTASWQKLILHIRPSLMVLTINEH